MGQSCVTDLGLLGKESEVAKLVDHNNIIHKARKVTILKFLYSIIFTYACEL